MIPGTTVADGFMTTLPPYSAERNMRASSRGDNISDRIHGINGTSPHVCLSVKTITPMLPDLGIGKLIGTPVPGTMTAVWWETQIDPTLVFGIPQVGVIGVKDGRYLENMDIEPDILVYNDPASILRGEDKQLEAAVAEMMKAIE